MLKCTTATITATSHVNATPTGLIAPHSVGFHKQEQDHYNHKLAMHVSSRIL